MLAVPQHFQNVEIWGPNALPGYLALSWHDADFARVPVTRYSSSGEPFTVLAPLGMPRINDQFLQCVFYLYPSRAAAEAGADMGGTGFVAGIKSAVNAGVFYGYAITNRHVAIDCGHSVIRLNKLDGSVDVRELDPAEWVPHPSGDDLAIVPLAGVKPDTHPVRLFDDSMFLTEASASEAEIGPGDEVFMVGRFVHHDGKERNEPSVRFGNISMRPMPIIQGGRVRKNFPQLSYAVELRSMGGYSGSPVFVYRGPWDMKTGNMLVGSPYIRFLGVNWGHMTDDWEVKERIVHEQEQGASPKRKGNYVNANTGMNGVVPAWKVRELMDHPVLLEHRNRQEKRMAAAAASQRGGVALDVSTAGSEPADENPTHLEDFRRLLGAAAKTQKPDDQT